MLRLLPLILLFWTGAAAAQPAPYTPPPEAFEVNFEFSADHRPLSRPGLLLEADKEARLFVTGRENFMLLAKAARLPVADKSAAEIKRDEGRIALILTFRIDMNMAEEPLFVEEFILVEGEPLTRMIDVTGYNLYPDEKGPIASLSITVNARPLAPPPHPAAGDLRPVR